MSVMIWIGAALTLLGVALLIWCVMEGVKARRSGLEGDALRSRLQRVIAVNLGALMLSALGLMAVVVGILLG
jgi:hypothetical protein